MGLRKNILERFRKIKQMVVCDLLHKCLFVCLPYKDENERGCSFITAISKVDGMFQCFHRSPGFRHENKCYNAVRVMISS